MHSEEGFTLTINLNNKCYHQLELAFHGSIARDKMAHILRLLRSLRKTGLRVLYPQKKMTLSIERRCFNGTSEDFKEMVEGLLERVFRLQPVQFAY